MFPHADNSFTNVEVANKDLIQEVDRLADMVRSRNGSVRFQHIGREDNALADAAANRGCNL